MVTVTRPGGATEITTQYLDGSIKSITGTGVVAEYHTRGVNADGTQWTRIDRGTEDSLVYEKTTTDALGRTIEVERPGPQGVEISQSFYNSKGQLVRQTQPGVADTLFTYDELGNQVRTALDVNGNGQIDLAGPDRVQETDSFFTSDGQWQQSEQRVYVSGRPVTVSTQRSRLTGFSSGSIAESVSIDLYGNQTTSKTLLNRSGQTVTQIVDVPDSELDAITISVEGRTIASTSSTGLTVAFGYDGLRRRTSVIDPRTGTSTTHYDALGRVDYVEDAGQRRTSFAYDAAGRKRAEVNAANKATYFEYTPRGELKRTWGEVPYPVEYGYDGYGRRTTMTTYRAAGPDGAAFSAATWPEPGDVTGDVTTWVYDEATGLLASKRDAQNRAVSYTYKVGGKLWTRTWARGVGAVYDYDEKTGELTSVEYADTTPDVAFGYDALGRSVSATDGTGSKSFGYDPDTLRLLSETSTGLVPSVVTHKVEPSVVPGRSSGYVTNTGHNVSYGYDRMGRFEKATWSVNGQSDEVVYARAPNSELLGSVTYASGVAVSYDYEPLRDLKTQVKNSFGASTVSQYDYAYDALGRRTSVANSGSAFSQAAFNKWNYNDRNELIESGRFLGTNVTQTNSPVAGEYRAYDFDPIGNRKTATEGAQQKSYAANAVNEYVTAGSANLTYDLDGNLTSDGTRRFVYDAENRLTLVEPVTPEDGSTRVRMAYDYLGRRVQKVVEEFDGSAWAAADDVRFVYVGWNVIEERKTSGGVTTKKNFVWGLDLSQSMDGAGGIGGLLAVVDQAGTQMAFLYDANGNVGQLVDEQGAVVARYEYDAFGQTLVTAGAAANENAYRFSTKYADEETGLVYYGYRFYDPAMGRWTQRDPIGERGGRNLFAFVSNRSTQLYDAFGLYQEAGHFYSVYIVAQAAGYSESEALELASYAQLPDEFGPLDAIGVASDTYVPDFLQDLLGLAHRREPTKMRDYIGDLDVTDSQYAQLIQNFLHSIPYRGKGSRAVEERRLCLQRLLRAGKLSPWEAGFVAHALGDSFSHSKNNPLTGEEITFEYPHGHTELLAGQGTEYDNIGLRQKIYRRYIFTLFRGLRRPGADASKLQVLFDAAAEAPLDHDDANAFFGDRFGKDLAYRPERGHQPGPNVQIPGVEQLVGFFSKVNKECNCYRE